MIVNYALKAIEQMRLHYSRLSKKERKRYAALEALKLGQDGVDYLSYVLGIRKNTIRNTIKEIVAESETPSKPKKTPRKVSSARKKNG
jgi:hypothetical protein